MIKLGVKAKKKVDSNEMYIHVYEYIYIYFKLKKTFFLVILIQQVKKATLTNTS